MNVRSVLASSVIRSVERAVLHAQSLRAPLPVLTRTAESPSREGSLRVVALGDIALLPSGKPSDPGWSSLLSPLSPLLGSADLTVANLESVLTSRTTPAGSIGSFLRADPDAVRALTQAGLDVVTCANNHSLDFGPEGLCESVATLREAGIESCGVESDSSAARPVILERNGTTIAVLGFCDDYFVAPDAGGGPRPAELRDGAVREAVAAARRQADVVIVNLHWGYEWSLHPMRTQRDRARAVADAGATIVLCHHAHVPMAMELHRDSVIAHGLGNCAFPWRSTVAHPWRNASYAVVIELDGVRVLRASAVPIHIRSDHRIAMSDGGSARAMLGGLRRLASRLQDDDWLLDVERSRMAREIAAAVRSLVSALERPDRSFLERCAWLRSPRQERLRGYAREQGDEVLSVAEILDRLATSELSEAELRSEARALEHPEVTRSVASLAGRAPARVPYLERIP